MFLEIKEKIEKKLEGYISNLDKLYSLSDISPLLFANIKGFALREGKRIRPTLFVIGYLGFAKETSPGLYTAAISLELLHDFMLVHDDIIDKSDLRRGKPSMHKSFNNYLRHYENTKFNGQDLALIAGDLMYAMAIHSFLSVKEDVNRKEKALKKLIETAIYTASGEFLELMLYGLKNIDKITKEDIYKIYDLKTANYTFSSPLSIGAILAGAQKEELDIFSEYGKYLGRAFQIKDDILGLFGNESKIGKSALSDLKQAKKTILIWNAYVNSNPKNKQTIKRILNQQDIERSQLLEMRNIVSSSGALNYAKEEINKLKTKAEKTISPSKMRSKYKDSLTAYFRNLLTLTI